MWLHPLPAVSGPLDEGGNVQRYEILDYESLPRMTDSEIEEMTKGLSILDSLRHSFVEEELRDDVQPNWRSLNRSQSLVALPSHSSSDFSFFFQNASNLSPSLPPNLANASNINQSLPSIIDMDIEIEKMLASGENDMSKSIETAQKQEALISSPPHHEASQLGSISVQTSYSNILSHPQPIRLRPTTEIEDFVKKENDISKTSQILPPSQPSQSDDQEICSQSSISGYSIDTQPPLPSCLPPRQPKRKNCKSPEHFKLSSFQGPLHSSMVHPGHSSSIHCPDLPPLVMEPSPAQEFDLPRGHSSPHPYMREEKNAEEPNLHLSMEEPPASLQEAHFDHFFPSGPNSPSLSIEPIPVIIEISSTITPPPNGGAREEEIQERDDRELNSEELKVPPLHWPESVQQAFLLLVNADKIEGRAFRMEPVRLRTSALHGQAIRREIDAMFSRKERTDADWRRIRILLPRDRMFE